MSDNCRRLRDFDLPPEAADPDRRAVDLHTSTEKQYDTQFPAMTFVTRIRLQSGNRPALERVVEQIRSTAERKGAELRGPHSEPAERLDVPLHKTTSGDNSGTFRSWDYQVFTRQLEIVGHNDVARRATEIDFPSGVHVEVELEQVEQMA